MATCSLAASGLTARRALARPVPGRAGARAFCCRSHSVCCLFRCRKLLGDKARPPRAPDAKSMSQNMKDLCSGKWPVHSRSRNKLRGFCLFSRPWLPLSAQSSPCPHETLCPPVRRCAHTHRTFPEFHRRLQARTMRAANVNKEHVSCIHVTCGPASQAAARSPSPRHWQGCHIDRGT